MSNITVHKIQACKFDYEFLGKSVQELAAGYGFRQEDIEQEIAQSGWVRRIEPTELPDTKDIRKFAEDLQSITSAKLTIISLFRQIEQQPLIAQLEKALLTKALELTDELTILDSQATKKLTDLVKAVTALQERNLGNLQSELGDKLKQPGVVVNIANQIN